MLYDDHDADAPPAPASPPAPSGGAPSTGGASPSPRYRVAPDFFPEREETFTLPAPFDRCTVRYRSNLPDATVRTLEGQDSILVIVQSIVTGWNLEDVDGVPIPCTPEAIEDCLPAEARATIWWEWRERRHRPLQVTRLLNSKSTSAPSSANGTAMAAPTG